MKAFKPFLALFALTVTLSSCDVEKIIDENFKEKSLVVVAPDFIKNRVTLVLKDADTDKILKEPFNVSVYSNKKIIDLAGNYQKDFIVNSGLLEFAIDPNEEVSESDPLELLVSYEDEQGQYVSLIERKTISRPGSYKWLLPSYKLNQEFSEEMANKESLPFYEYYLTFNGMYLTEYEKAHNFTTIPSFYNKEPLSIQIKGSEFNKVIPTETSIKIAPEFLNSSLRVTYLEVSYFNPDHKKVVFKYKNGGYTFYVENEDEDEDEDQAYRGGDFDERNSKIIISEGSYDLKLNYIIDFPNHIGRWDCDEGYNFKFNGIPLGEEVIFEYKTMRLAYGSSNNYFISSVGYANVNNKNNTINTGEIYQSPIHNKLIFASNNQYNIDPQQKDLGHDDACRKTFEFTISPKNDLQKYKLNMQFQCEGDNFTTAPSVTAFLKESPSNVEGDLVSFNNGGTTLYLKPGTQYEVNGNFNGDDFNFSFTNDQASIESALNESLSKNTTIKDIEYSFTTQDGVNVINAKLIFKKGECPL